MPPLLCDPPALTRLPGRIVRDGRRFTERIDYAGQIPLKIVIESRRVIERIGDRLDLTKLRLVGICRRYGVLGTCETSNTRCVAKSVSSTQTPDPFILSRLYPFLLLSKVDP